MLGRKGKSLSDGVIGQVTSAGHGPKPLLCVALLNPCPQRQLRARRCSLSIKVLEESQLVSDGTEHRRRECARVSEHSVYELLHLLLVDHVGRHADLLI